MGCCSSKPDPRQPHADTIKEWESRRQQVITTFKPIIDEKLMNDNNTKEQQNTPENLWGYASQLSSKCEFSTIFDKDATKYDSHTTRCWNMAARSFPVIVVRIAEDNDAHIAVSLAKAIGSDNIKVSMASGYHALRSFRDGGLAIDSVLRKDVRMISEDNNETFSKYKPLLDEVNATAIMEFDAGARIDEVQAVMKKNHVIFPTGTNVGTGQVGLILAGGLGWNQIRFGFSCDHLLYADVALADGTIVRVDASNEHSDMLYLMKGSGFCAGMILRMGMRCFPFKDENVIRNHIVELALVGDTIGKKKAFIRKYEEACRGLSDYSFVNLTLPVGAPVVVTSGIHYIEAPGDNGKRALEDYEHVQEALAKCCCQPKEFHKENFIGVTQRALEPKQQSGFYYQSFFALRDLSDAILDVLLHYTTTDIPKNSETALVMFPVGGQGAILDKNNEKTSFAQRQGYKYVVLVLGRWQDSEFGQKGKDSLRLWYKRFQKDAIEKAPGSFSETAHQFSTTDGKSGNQMVVTAADGGERQPQPDAAASAVSASDRVVGGSYFLNAPPKILEKLRKTVERYDPENVFVRNRSLSHENACAENA